MPTNQNLTGPLRRGRRHNGETIVPQISKGVIKNHRPAVSRYRSTATKVEVPLHPHRCARDKTLPAP